MTCLSFSTHFYHWKLKSFESKSVILHPVDNNNINNEIEGNILHFYTAKYSTQTTTRTAFLLENHTQSKLNSGKLVKLLNSEITSGSAQIVLFSALESD